MILILKVLLVLVTVSYSLDTIWFASGKHPGCTDSNLTDTTVFTLRLIFIAMLIWFCVEVWS